MRPIDTEMLLRGLAIAAVVFNHSHDYTQPPFGYGGGMTILMMLSGYSFARLVIAGNVVDQASIKALRFAWQILWPSFLLVVCYFLGREQFDLAELLFVSNWITVDRISIFPVWYVQVIVQMMLGLALFFSIPSVAREFQRRPLLASLVVFLVAAAIRFVLPMFVWDTDHLRHQLPHLFLWNFSLGWVLYFCLSARDEARSRMAVPLAFGCLLLGMLAGWELSQSDFWLLGLAGSALVLVRCVYLPLVLHRALILLSHATFVIFLLHRQVLAYIIQFSPGSEHRPMMLFVGAFTISFLAWFVLEACVRAYRSRMATLRRETLAEPIKV